MEKLSFFLIISALLACVSDDPSPVGSGRSGTGGDWLIPVSEVFDVLGRDGIPSLSNPRMVDATDLELFEPELILGFYDGITAIAYPHRILDWHEIINQRVNNFFIAVTYCPLTGTGIGWTQEVANQETEFGVSGLLYNSNLIAFDRNTKSNWSQIRLEAVNGPLSGTKMPTFQVVETRWSVWKQMYPDTKVVSEDTGWDRPYGVYPYGDYRTNNDNLLFPVSIDDGRLERKERVHGVILNGKAKVYRFSSFEQQVSLIADSFEGEDLVIVGSSDFIVSFEATLSDGSKPNLTPMNEGRVILADDQGNQWDIFGLHVSGPTPLPLKATQSFMGYWFAWGAFYPNAEIYGS